MSKSWQAQVPVPCLPTLLTESDLLCEHPTITSTTTVLIPPSSLSGRVHCHCVSSLYYLLCQMTSPVNSAGLPGLLLGLGRGLHSVSPTGHGQQASASGLGQKGEDEGEALILAALAFCLSCAPPGLCHCHLCHGQLET